MALPEKPPVRKEKSTAQKKPEPKQKALSPPETAGEALALKDTNEDTPLPAYPSGARVFMGTNETYTLNEEDTFIDIARHFGLGYVEIRGANPDTDPWAPVPGSTILIPNFSLLPRAKQDGIVVNLGKMRLYYFKKPGAEPISYPIGIGREGLQTPTGATTIVRKAALPQWHPTDRMRTEKPWLPKTVAAGASNPLGEYALYLGWPTFLIHGSNKPWGIGRRVSSGCIRMYPEDIKEFFKMINPGTPVTVVDQPILLAWVGDKLYLEANPTQTQSVEVEVSGRPETFKPLTDILRQDILKTAGADTNIDWKRVEEEVLKRSGQPVVIAERKNSIGPKPKAHEAAAASGKIYNK